MTLVGCMDDFGDMNIDPNKPSEAHTSMLFTNAATYVKLFTMNSNYYNPWSQMFPGYMSEALNNQYGKLENNTLGTTDFYRYAIKDLTYVIDYNKDESKKNTAAVLAFGTNENQIAAAITLRSFIYMHLTDALGPIPYTEAIKAAEDNFTPKFDSQKDIYEALDKELTEAYGMFQETSNLTGAEFLFKGDISKWKKFNSSVRMMLAIKLSDIEPAVGKVRFAAAYNQNKGMTKVSDNLMYTFDSNTVNYLFYQCHQSTGNFVPAEPIVAQLVDLKDPRLFKYCSLYDYKGNIRQTDEGFEADFGHYKGQPLGLASNSDVLEAARKTCYFNPVLHDGMENPFPVITAARILLIQAEAAQRGWIDADAATLYKAGIQASYDQWGVTESVDSYLAQSGVKYEGTDDAKIKLIGLQRWIAGYMADGYEAWSDWRRLDVPALHVGPGVTIIDHMPYRHEFDSEIYNYNKANYDAAVKADLNGNDSRSQRVWWDTKDNAK